MTLYIYIYRRKYMKWFVISFPNYLLVSCKATLSPTNHLFTNIIKAHFWFTTTFPSYLFMEAPVTDCRKEQINWGKANNLLLKLMRKSRKKLSQQTRVSWAWPIFCINNPPSIAFHKVGPLFFPIFAHLDQNILAGTLVYTFIARLITGILVHIKKNLVQRSKT